MKTMVKFQFELSAVDAENLISILREDIHKYNMMIIDALANKDERCIKNYKAQIVYTEKLIEIVCRGSSNENG